MSPSRLLSTGKCAGLGWSIRGPLSNGAFSSHLLNSLICSKVKRSFMASGSPSGPFGHLRGGSGSSSSSLWPGLSGVAMSSSGFTTSTILLGGLLPPAKGTISCPMISRLSTSGSSPSAESSLSRGSPLPDALVGSIAERGPVLGVWAHNLWCRYSEAVFSSTQKRLHCAWFVAYT